MALNDLWSSLVNSLDYTFSLTDDDWRNAYQNCYYALCWNQGQGAWYQVCDQDGASIRAVIGAYIYYFTHHPNPEQAKYYYDEWSDRSDPYRKALIERISILSSQPEDFCNAVLSYMYWGAKRGKVNKGILRPLQVEKFRDPKWWQNGNAKILFQFNDASYKLLEATGKTISYVVTGAATLLDAAGEVVEGVANGAADTIKVAGTALSYLPYILAAGVIGIVGFQVYKIKKTGKLYTPLQARKELLGV